MNIVTKIFICVMFIISSMTYGESINNIEGTGAFLLKDSFEIVINQRNKLEKKGNNLFLTLKDPNFFIEENNSTVRRQVSVPMVGVFQKHYSDIESLELKEFATIALSHPLWLTSEDGLGTAIKVTQDQKSISGKIKTTPPYDKDIAVFLEKQNTFFSKQLSNMNQYMPIKAIQVSHSVETVQNQIVVKLHIKNIGKEKIQLKNPLMLHTSMVSAPHLWNGVIFQLFDKSKDLNRPDFAFTFKAENIDFNESKEQRNAQYIVIKPKEEKVFLFRLTSDEKNQIPNRQYDTRVLMAFPFEVFGMNRVEVPTDRKKFTKN